MSNPHVDSLPPLSLYIHIPWCIRKCPYCDFNSHANKGALPEDQYVDALIADLDQELIHVQGRQIQSVFFGGGTPSLFSVRAIENILFAVQQRIPFMPKVEITLEANPGTVEQHKFAGYRNAGVNRLSIGIQSFHNVHLEKLGRIHSSNDAINAVRSAQSAGFNDINIDLMHGLSKQTQSQALDDLKQAIELSPTHISWYQLTIEPNTTFYNSPPILPSDEQLADIQSAGEELLQHHQFMQYEVSAYSQSGKHCKHNLNYWLFGDYLGIGAGAHGKITSADNQSIRRFWKTRVPNSYLDKNNAFCVGEKLLEAKELPIEFMMNALRLREGFTLSHFYQNTGLPLLSIEKNIQDLIERGLIKQKGERIMTSAIGRRFLNEILVSF